MRVRGPRQLVTSLALVSVLVFGLVAERRAEAGGALIVGGTFGPPGQPFLWSTATEVQYRTDGGPLGILSNATANQRVAGMFQVWEDVPTAAIGFNRAGDLLPTGVFSDGNVDTTTEFNAVVGSCDSGQQSPIIYDEEGGLFLALGLPSGVIGFAGPCAVSSNGQILSAVAALNGNFRDGAGPGPGEPELTDNEFDAVFIHEFGHFFGLDHSQINFNCLIDPATCPSFSDDSFGLPTMFPFLLSGLQEAPGVHPARTLSMDDIAWVSRLYPDPSFSSTFGAITGTILFSDGTSPIQDVNVIARRVDNPRRFAVSVVSGYLFTANPGQNVTATYLPCSPPSACPPNGFAGDNPGSPFGSHDPSLFGSYETPGLTPGSYTVEIESVSSTFQGGSSVGPLDFPIPMPAFPEFFNFGESANDSLADFSAVPVSAGATSSNINIILNGTRLAPDGLEPNDTLQSATVLGGDGGISNLLVGPFPDEDFYSFVAIPGQMGQVNAANLAQGPLGGFAVTNPVVEILDANGQRLHTCKDLVDDNSSAPFADPTPNAFDDACLTVASVDSHFSGFANLFFQMPTAGPFFIHVLDFRGTGRTDFAYGLGVDGSARPVPTLTSLSPSSALSGGSAFTLTVNGTGFSSSSVVFWNGSNRGITFANSNQLQAFIPSGDIATGGTASVTVFNPSPGGGTSNSLTFAINNHVPTVVSSFPDSIPATSPSFTLTLTGADFIQGSIVRWNGVDRTTTFVNGAQLTASVLASDIAAVGTAQVRVFNPAPGGGLSNAVPFTISLRNPLPTVTRLSPGGVVAGGPDLSLAVIGTNFVFNSVARVNNNTLTTTFIDSIRLETVVPANRVMNPGTPAITVVNPSPGGGTSNAVSLDVLAAPNPVPVLGSLMPNGQTAGVVRDTLTLAINGSNFVDGSVVRWNGMDRSTSFLNPSQLTAIIPASDLTAAGAASVTVFTPAPGGGTSSPLSFAINNPAPALTSISPSSATAGNPAFTLTVIGSNFVPGSIVRWNGFNRPTTFIGNSQLRAAIPATDVASAGSASVTVLTPAPGGGQSVPQSFTINSAAQAGLAKTKSSPQPTETEVVSPEPGLIAAGTVAAPVLPARPPAPLILRLEPSFAVAGSAELTLSVRGENFTEESVARLKGKDLPTEFISEMELEVELPATALARPSELKLTVFTPGPTGGTSKPATLTITPQP